jgi:dimethylamine monooxygenase subunit A
MAFDFSAVAVPFRMQPGLRKLAPGAAQLTPTRPGAVALAEKLAVLSAQPGQALLCAGGFDAAPALRAVCEQAAGEHPGHFDWDGDAALDARALGCSLRGAQVAGDGPVALRDTIAALPSEWRLAGLLCLALEEDLAVIDGTTARIPWLAVCLPSHWAPADKVGRHFAEVHAPVADNQLLLTASEHLARLVTGTQRWERYVWTVTRQPRLDAHPARAPALPWPADVDADALAAGAFFRTERQTFVPLGATRQAVFTIHVDVQPLADAVRTPERARTLHAALESMSPAVLAYRNLVPARERLLEWLAGRTAGRPAA